MDNSELIGFFKLDEHKELFVQALTPKSCGGGDEFKFLALYGDKILDLMLIEIFSENGLIDTGSLSPEMDSVHNERTLNDLGRYLNIDRFMHPIDINHIIKDGEVKEGVEALLGATYKVHGFRTCQEVVKNILEIVDSINQDLEQDDHSISLDANPIGKLQELFDKNNFTLPCYTFKRVGGSDHEPLWECTGTGNYFDEYYEIKSEIFPRKMDAKRDCAQKFLFKLGDVENATTNVSFREPEEKIIRAATQSVTDLTITFSKPDKEGVFNTGPMKLSTNTGEALITYAKKKAKKNPFGMLLLLSARLDELSGAAWSASLTSEELILLNVNIDGKSYFEVGAGQSKTKARKQAAAKTIQNTSLFDWLNENYKDQLI